MSAVSIEFGPGRCVWCYDREQGTHGLVKREWDGNHMMYVSVCRLHSVEDGNFRRVRQFDREFPKIRHREHWLTLYLALRDGGDSHITATETVRGERQMEGR